jgi:heme oxygenase (biliverdin-IX-beta and delta-forming)
MVLLESFYGFMKPVQDRIDFYLDDALVVNYSLRRRPERLLNDIEAFGGNAERMALCRHLPAIDNIGQAFGAHYVLEGSIHGGPAVRGMIIENLGLTDETGLSFFMGYGTNNGKMWASFVQSLEENSIVADTATIVESARKTFECLKNWLIEAYGSEENKKAH